MAAGQFADAHAFQEAAQLPDASAGTALTRKGRIALATIALTLCYAQVIGTMVHTWTTTMYSYGFVVLLISAYIVWTGLPKLRALPPAPDCLFGVPVTLAGMTLLAVGRVAALTSVQEASLVVSLAGFVLLFFGRKVLAHLWFPLAYLSLAISIWGPAISRLQAPSQLVSARIAARLLQTVGIPVFQQGSEIVLPNLTMEVMRECSGVNQLLAIVALTLPAAYLLLDRYLLRIILVGFAVVVAYVSNGVRIALVGVLAYRGLSDGDLRVHLFEGLVVSGVGYLLIYACLSLLSRVARTNEPREARATSAGPSRPATVSDGRRAHVQVATVLVVLLTGTFQLLFRPVDVRLSNDLRNMPSRIGEWTIDLSPELMSAPFPAIDDDLVQAHPEAVRGAAGERRFTAVDDELVRAYRNAAGDRIRLYIGYHRFQSEGKELAGDTSRALSAVASTVKVQLGSETIELGQVVRATPECRRGVLYWYDVNGRVVDSMYLAKGYMVWDALTRRRTNGAVVMIAWDCHDGRDPVTSQEKAIAFARAILPLLPHYIPS